MNIWKKTKSLLGRAWLTHQPSAYERAAKVVDGTFQGESSRRSIAYFSLYKAGSTFIAARLARRILTAYPRIDLESFCVKKFGSPDFSLLDIQRILRTPGVFFASLRTPVACEMLDRLKVILVVRDPRDILTSLYFSLKFSHTLLTDTMKEERQRLQTISIDEFVLGPQAEGFGAALVTYASWRSMANVLALKYEDIVVRPRDAEESLSDFLELQIQPGKLFDESDFAVDEENVMSHKRRVAAGDHLEKLKPDTIRELNRRLGPALSQWGYDTSASCRPL